MRTLIPALAGGIAMAAALLAQWPDYKTSGVPRSPDGKPILDGPTPKTPDGHPDFSGVWALRGGGGGFGRGQKGGPKGQPAAGVPAPPPPSGPPAASFKNIGQGFKEGLPLLPLAADLLKKRRDENSKDNPDAHCLPLGPDATSLASSAAGKLSRRQDLTVILYEAQAGVRQIFTDGRPLTPPNNVHNRGGTATRLESGKATRWWSRPPVSATTCGSISTARR